MGWDSFACCGECCYQGMAYIFEMTYENIRHMKGQLNKLGLSYDWDREVNHLQPDYTLEPVVFIRMMEKGLPTGNRRM